MERYKEVRPLGAGSFGAALLVEDTRDSSQKVLKRVLLGQKEESERSGALKEALLLSKLDHPNILKFYESFIDSDFVCIVTEYCEGGDLYTLIQHAAQQETCLPQQKVMDWFVQLTMALQYLHERGVLHRDLKSKNIFIKQGIIKLGDFGIARVLMGTMEKATTFAGTPYYMSPEVLQGVGYNEKSDIWALGCIFYEMCTMKQAFEGEGLLTLLYNICNGQIPSLPESYDRNMKGLSRMLWERDPKNRPTASEILLIPFVVQHMVRWNERLSSRTDETIFSERMELRDEIGHVKKRHRNRVASGRRTASPAKATASDKGPRLARGASGLVTRHQQASSATSSSTQRMVVSPAPARKEEKVLTPRERLLLRKRMASDQRARELKEAAAKQRQENISRHNQRTQASSSGVFTALYGEASQLSRSPSAQLNNSHSNVSTTSLLSVVSEPPDPHHTGDMRDVHGTSSHHHHHRGTSGRVRSGRVIRTRGHSLLTEHEPSAVTSSSSSSPGPYMDASRENVLGHAHEQRYAEQNDGSFIRHDSFHRDSHLFDEHMAHTQSVQPTPLQRTVQTDYDEGSATSIPHKQAVNAHSPSSPLPAHEATQTASTRSRSSSARSGQLHRSRLPVLSATHTRTPHSSEHLPQAQSVAAQILTEADFLSTDSGKGDSLHIARVQPEARNALRVTTTDATADPAGLGEKENATLSFVPSEGESSDDDDDDLARYEAMRELFSRDGATLNGDCNDTAEMSTGYGDTWLRTDKSNDTIVGSNSSNSSSSSRNQEPIEHLRSSGVDDFSRIAANLAACLQQSTIIEHNNREDEDDEHHGMKTPSGSLQSPLQGRSTAAEVEATAKARSRIEIHVVPPPHSPQLQPKQQLDTSRCQGQEVFADGREDSPAPTGQQDEEYEDDFDDYIEIDDDDDDDDYENESGSIASESSSFFDDSLESDSGPNGRRGEAHAVNDASASRLAAEVDEGSVEGSYYAQMKQHIDAPHQPHQPQAQVQVQLASSSYSSSSNFVDDLRGRRLASSNSASRTRGDFFNRDSVRSVHDLSDTDGDADADGIVAEARLRAESHSASRRQSSASSVQQNHRHDGDRSEKDFFSQSANQMVSASRPRISSASRRPLQSQLQVDDAADAMLAASFDGRRMRENLRLATAQSRPGTAKLVSVSPEVSDPIPTRVNRMASLRKEGKKQLGPVFTKVYDLIREARTTNSMTEAQLKEKVEQYAPYRDCFVIDQLVFMEMNPSL